MTTTKGKWSRSWRSSIYSWAKKLKTGGSCRYIKVAMDGARAVEHSESSSP
jgi:hypothetical protein